MWKRARDALAEANVKIEQRGKVLEQKERTLAELKESELERVWWKRARDALAEANVAIEQRGKVLEFSRNTTLDFKR